MTTIEPWLREILRCPSCGGRLQDITGPTGAPQLQCVDCSLAYRVDDQIPVLLVDEACGPGGADDPGGEGSRGVGGRQGSSAGSDPSAACGEPSPGQE